jgi:hypothetical protein
MAEAFLELMGRLGYERFGAQEAVAGKRGDHEVEVARERLDHVQVDDDRTRPAVQQKQRQRVLARGADVDEVDALFEDGGRELGQCVQLRLLRAPVVVRPPVLGELLQVAKRNSPLPAGSRKLVGPPGASEASARSSSSACGVSTWKGWMSVAMAVVAIAISPLSNGLRC